MMRTRIIFRIDTDELRSQSDKIVGSLVKAVVLTAEHHPTETGILSWYAKNHASLLFIPRTGNARPNPRYEIYIDGVIITKISIVSPQDDYAKEHLV